MDCVEPVNPSLPVQEYEYNPEPPDGVAAQVADPPAAMDEGETEQLAARVGVTLTVAEAVFEPPAPLQVMEYVVVLPGVTVVLPDVALPVAKLELVQEVAFVEDQVSCEACPEMTETGEALKVTVGASAATFTVAVH